MPKAKTIDRIEYSKRRCPNLRVNAQVVRLPEYSPFLKMREEMLKEHPELRDEMHACPVCNSELIRYEGCYRCKKCGYSRC